MFGEEGAGGEAGEEGHGEAGEEAMEVEGEEAAAVGGDAAEWWDEGAAPTPAKAVAAIKKHHVYTAGATAGSMATVWMNLEFADGTATEWGSVEPSEVQSPTWRTPASARRSGLRRYVATGKRSNDGQVHVPAGYFDA